MRISIIVPAFNEEKLLPESLRRINAARPAFQARGWDTELIVCDNNSTDRTAELARAEGATVVFEPVNQIGRARNRGAAAASGDWLLFIDADSRPTPELFADVAEAIRGGACLAGGSTVQAEGRHRVVTAGTALWNWLSRRRRLLAGSFIFCETAAFREVGGFNHELFAGEEIDLSRRLRRVAARQGRQLVILHRHPLWTSNRRIRLYRWHEQVRFGLRTLLTGGWNLRSRKGAAPWYDGRR